MYLHFRGHDPETSSVLHATIPSSQGWAFSVLLLRIYVWSGLMGGFLIKFVFG